MYPSFIIPYTCITCITLMSLTPTTFSRTPYNKLYQNLLFMYLYIFNIKITKGHENCNEPKITSFTYSILFFRCLRIQEFESSGLFCFVHNV